MCFDQREVDGHTESFSRGRLLMLLKQLTLISSIQSPEFSLQHSQTCSFFLRCAESSFNYRLLPLLYSELFLNRWISPPCLQANWLYPSCSLHRPQPSLPSLYSYHFEEVHNKFPLFELAWKESAQLVSNSPCC